MGLPNTDEQIWLFRRMALIRAFEERVIELYHQNQLAGLIHVGIGQEAVCVAIAARLEADDYLYGTHRSHGHFLAKGADPDRMMAELAGRATGYCEGLGGSMHLVAAEVRAMGATGIVVVPLTGFQCDHHGFRATLLEADDEKRAWILESLRVAIDQYVASGG